MRYQKTAKAIQRYVAKIASAKRTKAKSATSGDFSHAATSGDFSHAATSGKNSIAVAIGRNSTAKSTTGNWIVLAEYGEWNGEMYPVLCVKSAQIDGITLKPDTWYKLENGEFVYAEVMLKNQLEV